MPAGRWSISGEVVDVRMSTSHHGFTNKLSISGHLDNGLFLIDLTPTKSEDDIAESAGWDGELLYLITRFPDFPGKWLPRDKSLGYVEPNVFSRYASDALASATVSSEGVSK